MRLVALLAVFAALVGWLAVSVGGREDARGAEAPEAEAGVEGVEPAAPIAASADPAVREAAAATVETPGAGAAPDGSETADGEPEYSWAGSYEMGMYQSMEEIYEDAVEVILHVLPKDWVEQQTDWVIDGKHYEKVPVFYFLEDRPIPDQATLDALYAEIEAVDVLVREQARESYRLYRACAMDYARHRMKRFPRDSNGEALTQEFLDAYRNSRYAISSGFVAGRWSYQIDFRSKMYPELEEALDVLDELAAEKVSIAERYLK